MEGTEQEENSKESESIVDDDMVSFFELLAQYDFEDRKKAGLVVVQEISKEKKL